jgi:hypothetical protein
MVETRKQKRDREAREVISNNIKLAVKNSKKSYSNSKSNSKPNSKLVDSKTKDGQFINCTFNGCNFGSNSSNNEETKETKETSNTITNENKNLEELVGNNVVIEETKDSNQTDSTDPTDSIDPTDPSILKVAGKLTRALKRLKKQNKELQTNISNYERDSQNAQIRYHNEVKTHNQTKEDFELKLKKEIKYTEKKFKKRLPNYIDAVRDGRPVCDKCILPYLHIKIQNNYICKGCGNVQPRIGGVPLSF